MPVATLSDDDLRTALELATEAELRELTDILFRPKFNPIDYVNKVDPLDVQSLPYAEWLDSLEDRFRFLAADGITVLQRRTEEVSYRQILVQVCRHLRLPYYSDMNATQLESEIFLHLLERAWQKMPAKQQQELNTEIQVVIASSDLAQRIPEALVKDPMSLVLKGGSAIAISSLMRPFVLRMIAQQFALHFARYEVARQTVQRGGLAALGQFHSLFAMKTAQQGMATNLARYGAARSAFAFIGPAMWTLFFADLGWRSISTNYARVIPTVFALAQIRLTRLEAAEAA
ncbi:hypothetical protein IQ266_14435 [filamentous cyanobacterium LEGE 11480]|uniref:Uncharacterized protein n=1 Tax=Romeriopsis navalis LEGE 11480 TaxID=2777977 RepID=A0A928Z2Z2_9CYAN|nr:hypothetical protein [Romeriopsis navalis]MBE9030931.1 hypothetical protein [Romeriopsis navalis LEGE 11480]